MLSDEVLEAVHNNYLHIHDKDYYPTKSLTCVQHPLDRILSCGFSAGHGESRPAKRIETASILGCISLETAQNEMHGGQAIPAFDFYLAPYVRNSYIEEIKNLEELNGKDYSHLYQKELTDYLQQPLDGLSDEKRIVQHAINKTVARVHQSMEAFIHNMNTIHSRGGIKSIFSSINIRHRYISRGTLPHPRVTEKHLSGRRQWRDCHLPYPDMEKETWRKLSAGRPQL